MRTQWSLATAALVVAWSAGRCEPPELKHNLRDVESGDWSVKLWTTGAAFLEGGRMGLVLTATTPAGTKACKLEVVVGLRKAGSTREIACQTYAVELDKRAAGTRGTEWRGSVRNLFPKPGDDKYGIGLDEGKYELTVRVRRTRGPEVAVKAMPVTVQSPYGH